MDKSDTFFVLNIVFMILALICMVISVFGIAPLWCIGWGFVSIQIVCLALQIFFGFRN